MIAEFATAVTLGLGTSSTASTAAGHRTAEVELRLDRSVAFGNDQPKATLMNTGGVRLVYDLIFKLERHEDGAWRWANRRQAFVLPLLELAPGATSRPEPIGSTARPDHAVR